MYNKKSKLSNQIVTKILVLTYVLALSLFYSPALAAAPDAFSPISVLSVRYTGEPLAEDASVSDIRKIIKAKKIEDYLSRYEGDLYMYAYQLVDYAEQYDLDYRLVASIGVIESGACTHMFAKNNCFGWGNKIEFSSIEESIRIVSLNLGGENPNTAHYYKPGYSLEKKMKAYNSVNPDYQRKLKLVMNSIEKQDFNL